MGQVGYLVAVEELLRDEQLDKRAWSMLDETRQKRADRFKVKGARAECIGAGLLILYFGQIGQGAEHRIKGDVALEVTQPDPKVRDGLEHCKPQKGWGHSEEHDGLVQCEAQDNSGQHKLQDRQEHSGNEASVIRVTARELLSIVEANKAAGYHGLTCKVAEHGKPYFEDSPIHFNISHSGVYVFGVFSDVEVGVDIQKCEGYKDHGIEDSFFHENEKRMFDGLPEEDRAQLFFTLWVKKESYGKLTGNGIPETISMDTSEKEKEVHWLKYQGPSNYAIMSCEKQK